MSAATETRPADPTKATTDYEAIVIGAGFGGVRMLHELRELGLSTKVLEAGTDVGGTWYWNRYPGARTDSESWVYVFWFDQDLLDDWKWSERFPRQPEVLRYLQHVVDRFDMRRDIQFETRVESAVYDEEANRWTITTAGGETFTCTYFIPASGILSVLYDPPFEGVDSFEGEAYQTARWPKEDVDFTGKRVGVIGTGATAVQVIPIVAQTAEQVTVFQRTPNYVMPARNRPLDDSDRAAIRRDYELIYEQTRRQAFAFPMEPAGRVASDVDAEEHRRILEYGWETGGFRFIFETFDDMFTDDHSSQVASEFVRDKIRSIVRDPKTAEKLCPTDYPLAAKRPPLGHHYYESFNRDNVSLVDVKPNPIERITPKGVRLEDGSEYEFDIIIYATGFDAVTGAMASMDIRGRDGQTIKGKWDAGPRTNLGIAVDGFPNMFMISGPQSPFANIPVIIDEAVKWIGGAVTRMREEGYDRIEATEEAVDHWVQHMTNLVNATVLRKGTGDVHSWFLGANIPGKPQVVLLHFGGAGTYFDEIHGAAERDYEGFTFSQAGSGTRELASSGS